MPSALKHISSFVLCLCLHSSYAQVDTAFVRHLEKNHLQENFQRYISTVKTSADSLHWLQVRYYLQYHNDSLVLKHYPAAKSLLLGDAGMLRKLGLQFLQTEDEALTHLWFSQNDTVFKRDDLFLAYAATQVPSKSLLYTPPEELMYSFKRFQKADKKNPAGAAVLSGLLPGAGKLVAGKKQSAIITFLSCSGFALQWLESSRRLGTTHPLSIINAVFFTGFYSANIYGAYAAVKEAKRETKQQFLYEVGQYYR
jgi:hypothetical protein